MAKDYVKTVQCKECGSESHPTVLHPEPMALKSENFAASDDDGREPGRLHTSAVTAKCKEI